MITTIRDDQAVQIEVEGRSSFDATRWNKLIDRSPQATALHNYAALSKIAEHSGTELHLLTGRIGTETVWGAPLFMRSFGPTSMLFSQPPGLGLSGLVPCMVSGDVVEQNRLLRAEKLMTESWSRIQDRFDPSYVHLSLARTLPISSLMLQEGLRTTPRFTYRLDLSVGSEELLGGFSSDARRNIQGADSDRIELFEGDRADIGRIITTMIGRYEEQDLTYPIRKEFVYDLYDALPDGTVTPYVIEVDGRFENGIIALDDGETVYRWQGGGKANTDVPVNDLLDWYIIRRGTEGGRRYYDFVGANTARISSYKAKFNPELVTDYQVEDASVVMRSVRALYQWFRARGLSPTRMIP